MEHRWGQRMSMDIPVRLDIRPRAVLDCRLRDASLSGAFVQTDARLPLWTHVQVVILHAHFSHQPPQHISAYVVRNDADGVALEWCDFAPSEIRDLLAAPYVNPVATRMPLRERY